MGRKANTVERILGKYVRYEDHCWVWTGKIAKNGYGHTTRDWKTLLAHRVVYEALMGPIPEGMTLDHLCRNKACVNPAHLEPVTQQVNSRRHADLTTHCPQGHEYDEENTYVHNGKRSCKTCVAIRAKLYSLTR